MLLEFKTKNFKSFLYEVDFKMTPANRQRDLNYSVLKEKIKSKEYRGLCSAVVYGANASGKTNIIEAMDVFKEIILRGNIRNTSNQNSCNFSNQKLELIPNNTDKDNMPTSFYIKFTKNNLLIEYELKIDLGGFLQSNYERKIVFEKLSINGKNIFSRTNDITFDNLKTIKNYLIDDFDKDAESAKSLSRKSLNKEELFLTNGFKTMFSSKIVNMILSWFKNDFLVFCNSNALETHPDSLEANTFYIEKAINEVAKIFGINSNAIGYRYDEENHKTELVSIFGDQKIAIPANYFESLGTLRFINIFPTILVALVNGSTIVLDEFDANIHPMAIMDIINIFHNDDININHAQLIFNTHNPIFLNANLFRRDEIKFVEKDDETHLSTHYSLSDFKTSGKNAVRKTEDYMNHYFMEKYGAIKDIHFEDIVKEVMGIQDEDKADE